MSTYLTPEDIEIGLANGICEKTLYTRFYHLGWIKERAITHPLQRNTGWKEMKHIAEQNGIGYQTYVKRINKGLTPEQAATQKVQTVQEKTSKLKDTRHRVFTNEELERAKANGISSHRLYARYMRGTFTKEEAITTPLMSGKEKYTYMRNKKVSFYREIENDYKLSQAKRTKKGVAK